MKHKFSRILGVGLSLMLLISLLAFAAPVSAGTLKWTTETIPSDTGKVLQPCDIRDFDVYGDGDTIYAVGGVGVLGATASTYGTATWETDNSSLILSGSSSAKLHHLLAGGQGSVYVEFVPAAGFTIADLTALANTLGFSYYLTSGWGPQLELKFTDPATDHYVEITLMLDQTSPKLDAWTALTANTTSLGLWYSDQGFNATLQALSGIEADIDAMDPVMCGPWQLTRVRVELWDANVADRDCYIDDVIVDGVTYDLEPGVMFKSTDVGESWSGITLPDDADSVRLVAVAPGDSDIVAITANHILVYITTDGGTTWGDLEFTGVSDGVINDIAISAESAGINYIALAARDGTLAEVWRYNIGSASPSWTGISATGADFESANTTAAVAFSPNFPSDQVMAVVTCVADNITTTTDYVKLQLWSENQDVWNGFDGYPAAIVDDDGITGLGAASISLDPEYLGSDDAMRMAFIGLTVLGDSDAQDESGIHRMDDTTHKALKTGATVDIHSIAFDGSTVVAGRHGTNTAVWRCADPLATSPSIKGASSLKRPGGQNSVVVAWAGTDVVAATSGDESAFAVSTNDGKAFNDISLIDTTLTTMTDVAVSPDGSVVYMATDDGEDVSLWRSAASWQRVLSIQDKAGFIIRLAPDDPDVVYIADKGTTSIYYSGDGGTERWQARTSRYPVQDLAVETDSDVAYVLIAADGKVSKSSNAGFTWGTSKSSKLSGGNMIVSLGEDALLAASNDGYVSYSSDGGDSFTKIGKKVGDTSADVVAIASGVADGDYIYTGLENPNKDIYRWQLGTSTSWSSIYEDVGTSNVTGMVLFDKVLYALVSDGTDNNTVLRSLDPTDAVSVSWSSAPKDDVAFDIEPQGLRVTGGSAKMWAIDTVNDALYSYTDTLAVLGPELVGPAQGFEVGINPVSGYTMDVTFSWEKPSDRVTNYELRLAFDSGFDEVAKKLYPESTSSTVGYVVGHSATGVFDLMPGDTYYWKVRVSSPLLSPWSVYRYVTVAEAVAPVTTVTVEPTPAPEITVTAPPPPEVTVHVPPTPTPVAPPPAIPAYLLWTIIAIGAVLFIALIVLIVRTRRVV